MSVTTSWQGVRLVAGRAIADGASSKSWRAVTALMVLAGLALVILPRVISGGPSTYTLAATEQTPPSVLRFLQAAGEQSGFELEVLAVDDAAAGQEAVRDGGADVAVSDAALGSVVYVTGEGAGSFPALVSQAVLVAATGQALGAAGLSQAEIAQIQSLPPPEQVFVGGVGDEGRAAIGFIAGIVLYITLILTGTTIATAVATEKTTRISEVLLAVLRPGQLLVGTVLGVGLLGLVQVAAIGVPVLVGLAVGDGLDVPASAAGDIVLAIGWFVLGISLYAFLFAALATLVQKVTEIGTAIMPVNVVLIGSYILAVTVAVNSPDAWLSVAGSLFPLSAPMVMPVRWAAGGVPPWQLVLAVLLTAMTAVLLARVASKVYARGLTMSGRRLRLREVIATRDPST